MLFFDATPAVQIGLLIALIAGITFHEFSHALVADQLGDHRPRALGRVSLNPVRHFEPIGAVMFLIAGFGWGKPVPINAATLSPQRTGLTLVAVAGPMANFVLAAVVAVLYRALQLAGLLDAHLPRDIIANVVFFNVALGIFNLLPIPPLDGYNVLVPLLPPKQAYAVRRYAPYGLGVLLGILVMSYLTPVNPLGWLFSLASSVARVLIGA